MLGEVSSSSCCLASAALFYCGTPCAFHIIIFHVMEYRSIVRPILEYGSSVWDPYTDKLQEELEKVQNRAARFVTRNFVYETGSMTCILGQFK